MFSHSVGPCPVCWSRPNFSHSLICHRIFSTVDTRIFWHTWRNFTNSHNIPTIAVVNGFPPTGKRKREFCTKTWFSRGSHSRLWLPQLVRELSPLMSLSGRGLCPHTFKSERGAPAPSPLPMPLDYWIVMGVTVRGWNSTGKQILCFCKELPRLLNLYSCETLSAYSTHLCVNALQLTFHHWKSV